MIAVSIHLECDDLDDVIDLQRGLMQRYHRVTFAIDQTDHVESVDDDDVDPDAIMRILEAALGYASTPETREVIERLIVTRPEPEIRPERAALAQRTSEPRVRPDDDDAESRLIKMQIVRDNVCPQCKALQGRVCTSPKGHNYSSHFVHQARINAWYEQRGAGR